MRINNLMMSFAVFSAFGVLTANVSGTDNVLLLIADDYGVDSMGLYAPTQDVAPTPNLDALAGSGIRFTNFWANPICSPTRAAILAGRHGFRTGVGSPQGNNTLPLTEYTLADVMNGRGYHTANFGKWHLGGPNSNSTRPNEMGWDHFAGILRGGVTDYFSWDKTVNGVTSTSNTYATTDLTDDAIAWINSKGNDPWFCWMAYNAPHTPFHVPPANLHTQNVTAASSNLQKYKAAVEALDTEIGRLMSSLDPSVLAETTVIFIGDNGTPMQVANGNNHDRGAKGSLYEGGVHTPFLVAGKAVVAPLNRTNDALVHASDLFATIAELGGYDVQTDLPAGLVIDSVSAVPYFSDPNLPGFHDVSFAERFAVTPAAADGKTARNTQYKYVRFDNGTEELYDLLADPLESTNLISSGNATIVANLIILSEYMDALLVSPLAPQVESVVVNNDEAQRSTLTEVVVHFDSNVAINEASGPAFQFTNIGNAQDATYTSNVELIGGKTKVTFTFTPGTSVETRGSLAPTLERGNYQLAVNAAQVTLGTNALDGNGDGDDGDDFLFGNEPGDNLFRIYGDADGSGFTDFTDFSLHFLPAFGSAFPSASYVDELDANGDTFVDFTDFSERFLPNFGQSP